MSARSIKIAGRISLLYTLVAGLWVWLSDRAVERWFPAAREGIYFENYKELGFIAVTALLLYFLVRGQLRKHEAEAAERQRAEAALRESDARFRQIAESLPQLVWACTPNGECDFLSQQWVEFTGIPASEQLGHRWLQQIHPDDRARITAAWQESVAKGSPFQSEYRIRHRDGSHRWFDDRAVPLRDAAGHIVKWFGSNTDIHAEHELRESLRASEEKLRAIFEAEPECLKLLEPDGTLCEINSAGLQILEAENAAAVLGQRVIPCVVPEHRANVLAMLDATARGEKRVLEFEIVGLRGTPRWMEMTTVPFRDPATGKQLVLGVSRDITERRRVEQLVVQSELRLQLVWDHALLAMRLADAEGNAVRVNPAYCLLAGKPRAELEGQLFTIAYAEKDRVRSMTAYRARFQNHVECQQRPADVTYWNGQRAQLEGSDSFLEIGGQLTLLLTLLNDVTLRKQAERRVSVLAEMTEALSKATTRFAAAECIVGAARKLLGWDSCFFHRYNTEQNIENILSRDTLHGQTVDVPMPVASVAGSPFVQEVMRRGPKLILRDAPAPGAEKLIPFGDTSRRSESLLFVPVRESGRTIGLLSIQSYTPHAYNEASLATLQSLAEHGAGALERIRAEEFLQTREQQFRSLIENTSDMIAVVDHEGRLGFQSPSVERVLGYRPEEASGRNVMDFVHPEDLTSARAALARALTSPEKPLPFEGRLRHRDGSWRRIQTIGRRAPETSGADAIILNARDVTESRALEERVRQSQRMEAIGQLAGGVAHDFNNLLAVIKMQVELLKLEKNRTSAHLDFANEIGKAAQRGANLTRQLLMFSRRQPAKLSDCDLNEIVSQLMKMLPRLLGEDVRIQVNYAPQPLAVHVDIAMVDQILLNLAVNARDAMPQGGRLTIETLQVEFDPAAAAQSPPAQPGRFACLSVSDTGNGIPPELLPHIFEPFVATKDADKGTDLGLATVFGIVQQHQGWINVTSEIGSGTTFRIYLPQHNLSPVTPVATPSPNTAPPGHETILIAEDETDLRELLHAILSRMGYRVLEASSGVVALEVWKKHHAEITLLLTDMVMPDGVSGRQLAQQLLAENPKLKVIYMSGYSQDIAGEDFPLREGENFLAKPFESSQLTKMIRARLAE